MPKPIPKQTKAKDLPSVTEDPNKVPETSKEVQEIPSESPENTTKLEKTPEINTVLEETKQKEEIPEETPEKSELPPDKPVENCVKINGILVEIKPTKLKYFRNKTAAAYNILKNIPLSELLTIEKGIIDEARDGDQIVFDFLIAAFDDVQFVKDNYDNLDADQIEAVVNIFGRLNHIEEKVEAQRKNREAQGNR